MKTKSFTFNSKDESLNKVIKEALLLFKIEICEPEQTMTEDFFDELDVVYDILEKDSRKQVRVTLSTQVNKHTETYVRVGFIHEAEREPAEIRRLVKLHVYDILREILHAEPAPWGILHGVRPTKIVHRYIERDFSCEKIMERLTSDYALSTEKAALMADIAFRQLPFLAGQDSRSISIYVGIPFCLSRCLYCSFPSYVLPDGQKLQAFMNVLQKDILAAKDSVMRRGLSVESIYIGGGTPTSLPNAEFTSFLKLVSDSFYQAGTTREFTVEAGRPDSVSDAKIASMIQHKVNRVSVNPQTMQEKTLKHIGRNHTPRDIIDLFGKFREAKMQQINMDIIIGLPGEDVNDVADTMRKIAELKPDNLTVHTLALKRGSRLKLNQTGYTLPDDYTARKMFAITQEWTKRMRLEPYYLYRQGYMSGDLENIGYSRPGAESLYNIKIMEEKQTIIGIGAAATTKIVYQDGRAMNTSFNAKDLITYMRDIDRYIQRRTVLLEAAFNNGEE